MRITIPLCLAFGLTAGAVGVWRMAALVRRVALEPPRPALAGAPQARTAKSRLPGPTGPAVAPIQFSANGGLQASNLVVGLLCATSGAIIQYTTDGSEPAAGRGSVYSEPLPIARSTVLRAVASKSGWAPSAVATRTYIFPEDVISSPRLRPSITHRPWYRTQMRDALLAIPSVSLVTSVAIPEEAPTYGGAKLVKIEPVQASIEWLAAEGGPGFQENCGAEYFGGAFTQFEKKNFRLHFRRDFGATKLKFPLFAGHEHGLAAVDEFDQLELRGGSHDMVERGFYMSNIFADDSMLEMGHLNPHGRFVHLYLNGTYWGVYHLRERWGADMHRRYLGGTGSDYESINGNRNVGGWAAGIPYDGDGRAWTRVRSLRRDYRTVRQWIDIPEYLDFMILWIYGRCEDEYRCVGPTIPGSGFKFYLNDADGFFQSPARRWYGEPSNRTSRGPGRLPGDGPGGFFSALLPDADYRTLLADRIFKAYSNGGALTFASVSNRLTGRCDELEKAFLAESARWEYRTPEDWRSVRNDVLSRWLPRRGETVLRELRAAGFYPPVDAPALNPPGGRVASGSRVEFQGSDQGEIFFTLDGSDPRLPGGGVAPSARRYSRGDPDAAALRIERNTLVKSRVRDGNQWSALNETCFQTGTALLGPGEIRIAERRLPGAPADGSDFVEVGNVSDQAVNLRGARFTAGIEYAFADHRDTLLAPGQKLILAKDLFRFRKRWGLEVAVEGIYSKKKRNRDDRITLSLESGEVIASWGSADATPAR